MTMDRTVFWANKSMTDTILLIRIWGEEPLQTASVSEIHIRCK